MRKFLCVLFTLILCLSLFAGCGSEDGRPQKRSVRREKAETLSAQLAQPADGDLVAVFDTSMGKIRAVLYPQYAPMAVENFTTLAEQGYYNDTSFHRVIFGFVAQAGDASGTGLKGSTIWNNQPFPAELSPSLHHFTGALCAANSPEAEASTTSQFYFVQSLQEKLEDPLRAQLEAAGTEAAVIADYDAVGGLPYLDYTDTVFGQIYDGLSILDRIGAVDTDEADRPLDEVIIHSITISTYPDD